MKVFFASCAPIEVARHWTQQLGAQKRARIDKMRREEDKALALTAHRLLCYALKTACRVVPSPGDFGRNTHGKPYLLRPGVHFNISHSGSMAMCAVHSQPVGVDIERVRDVGAGVAARVLSPDEWRVYQDAPEKEDLFFKIWTLKEAYLKYRGIGLGCAPHTVTAYPAGGSVCTDTGCAFWMFDDIPGYRAAACAQQGPDPSVHVVDADRLRAL